MKPFQSPRCQITPLPDHQAAFSVDGVERLRWHFGPSYPRPFFYPLTGPSGSSLSRMGHPGAANHDHHRSVWFAHHSVTGVNFWSDQTDARVRQREWLVYDESDDEAVMAVRLGWHDGHDPPPLMEQTLVAILRPLEEREFLLELQSTFVPRSESIELGQTNFGFLAVRVAKNLSAYFGGGEITSSSGSRGEPDIFGREAGWMDYSGPVPADSNIEGITYFDHPNNPTYPSKWHVREDGWMGASVCRDAPLNITQQAPLRLRYLLHVHGGEVDAVRAERIANSFARGASYKVVRSPVKHRYYQVERIPIDNSPTP